MQGMQDFLRLPLPLKIDDTERLQILNDLENQLQRLQATDLEPRSTGFLGVNISSRARREMRPTIEQLFNVPAYRIQASCRSSNLSAVSIGSPDKNDSHVRFNLEEAATSSVSGPTQFRADFGIVEGLLARQGIEAARTNGSSVRYPLIAFSGTATWIGGFSYTGNKTAGSLETTGNRSLVPFRAKGVVRSPSCSEESEPRSESYDLTFWGVVCSLKRWSGTATANLTGTTLTLTQSRLDGEKVEAEDETPILFLGQKLDTFENGRVGRSPGIGGYLLRAAHRAYREAGLSDWDVETLVDAFVWYEAAVREEIQGNKSDAKIEGVVSQVDLLEKNPDTYTMTFVPWMLLFGLVALGVACALTVALSLDSLGVPSFRSGRVLDAVRLTADLGRTLGRTAFEETYWMSRQELNECAEGARFKYEPDRRLDKNRESPVSPLSVDEPASPPPTVANETKTQATSTDSLLPKDAVDEEGEQAEMPTYRRASRTVLADIVVVSVIASVAMCVSFSLILHIKLNTRKGFTQSEPIGGRFSLFQGTVGDRPVNLKALTELAGTDWGSCSPLKHWTFVRTRDPRLICLATVALLSALSFSFLTNVTAYEAIGFNIVNVTQKVETLYGPKDDAPATVISDILNSTQDIKLSAQLTNSLHDIPLEIGTSNTSHQAVLNVVLQARLLRGFHVRFDSADEAYAEYHLEIQMVSNLTEFKGSGSNMAPSLKGKSNPGLPRPLLAFKDEKIWIGWIYYTEEKDTATYPTVYGRLDTYRYCPEKDNQVLDWTIFGVTCQLSTTMGTATVNRKNWSISDVHLDERTRRFEERRPLLDILQNKWEIASPALYNTTGLGGHLADAVFAPGSDFQMSHIHYIVKSFAWLEAKMRDVAYNMAERDSGRNVEVEVMAEGNGEQLYTMTFVPWILLTGLFALGTAGLLAIGLALDFLRTPSLRSGRMLSPVRLMMDVGAVLDKDVFEQALTWDGNELDSWAQTVELQYEPAEEHGEASVTEDGDYDCCMRLRHIRRSGAEG
ncbi:hypothetical protein NCS52_00149500 [Fusarium sp. LHS14.1]|nr:hypothetical protein NCS52_00149500 [Fusarium sp. LHS14.1]